MTKFFGPPLAEEPGQGAHTIGGLLQQAVSSHSAREAIAFTDFQARSSTNLQARDASTVRWTYADLLEHTWRLAKALVAAGIGKGTRVALLMGNRPEWVESAFAVALAGGVAVPVNTLFEAPEIEHVLRHSDCSLVLHQRRLGHHDYDQQLTDMEARLPFLTRRYCLGTADHDAFLLDGCAVPDSLMEERAGEVSPFDDALIIYTSGSTGRPKGVLHAHRAAAIQSWRFAYQLCLDPSVRVWSAYPFFWTAGFCMVMGATLAAGGCLVLQEIFDAGDAIRLLQSERVTTPYAWPHQLAALEAHPSWEGADFSSVRHADAVSALGRHHSVSSENPWSPRAAYGLTETFTIISSVRADTPPEEREGHEGVVLPGNCVRIVDSETQEEQPAGIPGEIRAKGPTLMKGYLKVAPEEVFDEDGFFPTADAGYVDERGRLHWVGRTGDLIKTGGANVSPVEIENELLHYPELQSASAVGVPHPTLDQIVVVCAVARSGSNVSEQSVRQFLTGKLASYKLPRRVLFFEDEELSLTASAKIRVDALRRLAQERLAAENAQGESGQRSGRLGHRRPQHPAHQPAEQQPAEQQPAEHPAQQPAEHPAQQPGRPNEAAR